MIFTYLPVGVTVLSVKGCRLTTEIALSGDGGAYTLVTADHSHAGLSAATTKMKPSYGRSATPKRFQKFIGRHL